MPNGLQAYNFDHIGFIVRDLEETVDHFKKYYNIRDFMMYDFSPTKAWSYGKEVKEYKLKIAMGTIPESQSRIEIIQSVSGDGVHKDFVGDGSGGFHHICFSLDKDYEQWRSHFKEQGTEFIFESETEDEIIGYRRCFYARDPITNMIFEVKEKPYFRKARQ